MEESQKLSNPFIQLEGYNCFGCCPHNEHGLKLSFTDKGDYIEAHWMPDVRYQGYKNILHGGIQTTLLDEIASWTVYTKVGTAGVTSKLEIKFLRPVVIDGSEIVLKSFVKSAERKSAILNTYLYDAKEKLCAEATIEYFLYPEELARKKLFFPGTENFYRN
ncbi:MAG TPA: PaaI family thioesterase [Bacteroidales bacterium]|nr:PaaI family thioesterase [Bacteroidales bacterium]